MNSRARTQFINSVANTNDIGNNSTQDSSTDVTQNGISKNVAIQNDNLEEEIFAQGLPNWDLEPPQVVVRRVRKK